MLLACVALMAGPGVPPARATDFFWQSDSGAFITPGNWDPFDPLHSFIGPGGAGDTVNFDRGVAPENRYTVFGVAGQNDRLLVHNDSLTLNITDDYRLLSTSSTARSFTVGVAAVPELGTLALAGLAALSLTALRRRRAARRLMTAN